MLLKSVDIASTFKTKSGQSTSNAAENLKWAILRGKRDSGYFPCLLFSDEWRKNEI